MLDMCTLLLTGTGRDTSVPTRLGLPLRAAIHPDAAHRSGLLGVEPVWEYNVPLGFELLLRGHVPGLQW